MALEVGGSNPLIHPIPIYARLAELADALDLGSSGVTRGGSTPPSRIFCFLGMVNLEQYLRRESQNEVRIHR